MTIAAAAARITDDVTVRRQRRQEVLNFSTTRAPTPDCRKLARACLYNTNIAASPSPTTVTGGAAVKRPHCAKCIVVAVMI